MWDFTIGPTFSENQTYIYVKSEGRVKILYMGKRKEGCNSKTYVTFACKILIL